MIQRNGPIVPAPLQPACIDVSSTKPMFTANMLKSILQSCIGAELAQVEKLLRAAANSRHPEVAQLCQAAAAMGGKRLRPTLVWLAAQACGGTPASARIRYDLSAIAAAVELVHAASLVHDDVMDAATERRHQPTIAGQAGNSAAVLLGDLLFTRAYGLAARCRGTYPARMIASAGTQLCEGELRQQSAMGQWSMSLAQYRSLLQQKTGALCAVSCRLGAWRMGAAAEHVRALTQFGRWLGLAFQIQDDWLDYWGTEQVGKTLGTDLAQAKPTLPLIRLLGTCSAPQRAQLLTLLSDRNPEACLRIRQRLDASDAGEYTLRAAQACCERAKAQLAVLPASEARDCLEAVADYSVRRSL
jgi:octaprenyl-diphosphate synthase